MMMIIIGSKINHSSTFLLLVKNAGIANTTELVSAVIDNISE